MYTEKDLIIGFLLTILMVIFLVVHGQNHRQYCEDKGLKSTYNVVTKTLKCE
jgi:hypothetical protein